MVLYKSQLYFLAKGDNSNFQLWKSDGTAGGTSQAFKVIDMDFASSNALKEFKIFAEDDELFLGFALQRQRNHLFRRNC